MRLIDGDALIEILGTAIRNMQGAAKFIGAEDDPELKMEIKAYTDILNGVKEQPTIEPEPQWIPCSERLPEEGCEALGTDKYGSVRHVIKDKCGAYKFATYEEMMHIPIVAWMPLPPSYKGEDE